MDETQILRDLIMRLAERIYRQSELLSKSSERATTKGETMNSIPGVGPDAPTITNAAGGKQSATPYRCDLVPPAAYLRVAAILAEGARKYGDENWRNISFRDHINHALSHVAAYLAADRSDDHIGHAMCRMMFAFETMDPDEDFPPSMWESFRPVILPSGSQSANPPITELVGVQP
jgi:hypothetical protein